ncbi:MAG: DNA polymerase III subunit psi [Bacteroidetes bacterium]|nr:DNA polymerase III subunit psi [Bacteroidota bacterium]
MENDENVLSILDNNLIYNITESEMALSVKDSNAHEHSIIGDISSKILIVSIGIEGPDQQFLGKILQSVKLDIEHVLLWTYRENNKYTFKSICTLYNPEVCLFFGITAADTRLFIEYKNYDIVSLIDRRLMFCDSLKSIAEDEKKKRLLWEAIQVLFNKK